MTIKAEIICDSLAPSGVRLTTFVLTYPRFIHSEFMTHRVFSRNASSSRAIPVKKSIQEVIDNPVIPLAFTKNKAGMQGGEPIEDQQMAEFVWLLGRDEAVKIAQKLADMEVHKQYANRVLEPYAHITVVVTATDWANFFSLRNHHMAQPEIAELAKQMWELYKSGTPDKLKNGDWHVPFVGENDWVEGFGVTIQDMEELDIRMIKKSVASCARVSYKNHDGTNSTLAQDEALYDRLLASAPLHASPAEHQAMAVGDPSVKSGNFRGWVQFRKTLANENVTEYNGPEEQ
jgi:thymidylate synthase ThyX